MEKYLIDPVAFCLQQALVHLDTVRSQLPDAFSGHQGIGIRRTDDYAADLIFNDRLCTRRRLSIVAAGLQSDIKGGSFWRNAAGSESVPFRVKPAVPLVIAASYDLTVLYDYSAYQGIGIYMAAALQSQVQSQPHILLIRHNKYLLRG